MFWKNLAIGAILIGTAVSDAECPADDDTPTPVPTPLEADLGYTCDVSFPALPSPPAVQRSFFALPTSNGFISATYAIELYDVPVSFTDGTTGTFDPKHRLITFTDHIMAQPTPAIQTKDLLYDFYFGVRVDGTSTWLSDIPEQSAEYVNGTGIIRLVQVLGDVEIETFLFAPFQGDSYSLVAAAHATNTGAVSHQVELFSLMNFHTGGEGHADGESVSAVGSSGILETRGTSRLYYRGLETPSHRSAGPGGNTKSNPWMLVSANRDLSDSFVSGDDVAAGFQWSLNGGTLGIGADAWGGLVVGYNGNGESSSALTARIDGFVSSRLSSAVVEAEEAFWDDFHARETPPRGISPDELAVYRQSTAVLKMGQVREAAPAYGQLLASLPPGGWNISWARDAAYAIAALSRAGHEEEARDALMFMIDGQAGDYASQLGIDDYLISACRYYGNGAEESDLAWCEDGSPAGPNIELDDFGLFLWAYNTYLDVSGDASFQNITLDQVLAGVADPLVALIDPVNNLLVADSSIWERHWNDCFPNGRKQFVYSSLNGVNGLRIAGERGNEPAYESAADMLRSGLLDLDEGPVLEESFGGERCPVMASSPEEVCSWCGPYDAAVVELINLEVIDPASALAKGTMRGLMAHLAMGNGSPGFLRTDDGSGTSNPYPWYDDQEWVVVDLRMASAMAKMGVALDDPMLSENAATLVDWVTRQARVNADLIAELYSDGTYQADDDADHTNIGHDEGYEYQGSVPMTGFGPGAYILALEAVHGR